MVMRSNKIDAERETLTSGDMRPGGNAAAALLGYVERFERLTEEVEVLNEDRKEVMAEAKATGFDTKILRKVIARRKMDSASRQEGDSLLELYEETLSSQEKAATQQNLAEGGE